MTEISFFVPGIPTAWARTASYEGRRLTPAKQRAAMNTVGFYYANGKNPVFAGPLHVGVIATYPRPKKHKPGKLWPEWKSSRPDIDNILKLVADGLNGVAWYDDAQIVSVSGNKIYGDTPGLSIEIRPLA